jgi:hypothetical protein
MRLNATTKLLSHKSVQVKDCRPDTSLLLVLPPHFVVVANSPSRHVVVAFRWLLGENRELGHPCKFHGSCHGIVDAIVGDPPQLHS